MSTYGYTGRPVLVKNVTNSWLAMETFSFDFFKDLYQRLDSPVLRKDDEDCQFFAWDFEEFESMGEVFEIPPERSNMEGRKKIIYILAQSLPQTFPYVGTGGGGEGIPPWLQNFIPLKSSEKRQKGKNTQPV